VTCSSLPLFPRESRFPPGPTHGADARRCWVLGFWLGARRARRFGRPRTRCLTCGANRWGFGGCRRVGYTANVFWAVWYAATAPPA
jgi:hypothetical protein